MKPANKMNNRQLTLFNIFIFIGILALNLLFNLSIILNEMIYHRVARYLLVISLVIFILNLILLNLNKSTLKFTSYILGTLMGNLTIFSMYLLALNYFKPEAEITRIILLLNFILVEVLLVYKRLIKKDNNYILSIKSGNHGKYVKKDIFLSLIISTIIIVLAKSLDVNPLNIYGKKIDVLLSNFMIIIITMAGIPLYVTAIANYIYAERHKK